jgi:hypothetical protein
MRLFGQVARDPGDAEPAAEAQVPGYGFSVHAKTRIGAADRSGRERLCRYLSKLAALVPPPRMHRTRYHGAWASHAKARAEVVPGPEPDGAAHRPGAAPRTRGRWAGRESSAALAPARLLLLGGSTCRGGVGGLGVLPILLAGLGPRGESEKCPRRQPRRVFESCATKRLHDRGTLRGKARQSGQSYCAALRLHLDALHRKADSRREAHQIRPASRVGVLRG